jgi:hypothetical protein
MKRCFSLALAGAAILATAACSDLFATKKAQPAAMNLSAAFATVPVGYTLAQTTYDNSAEGTGPFFPQSPMGEMGHGLGASIGGGFGPMIGGGLGADFLGGLGLGHDFGRGPLGDPDLNSTSCSYSAATGRVACNPVTNRGLTTVRSSAYTDVTGAPQSAFDSVTTNTINTQVQVTGTITRRDSSTSTITNTSDRTVGGLAKGSTQHTVNGTAAGNELSNGTDSTGAFTALRTAADTTRGIIVPVSTAGQTYPIAGTIIRVMAVTVTQAGGSPQTSTRREVITYDGSSTAQMVITQDGTTKTCTLPLPFGRPTCQ